MPERPEPTDAQDRSIGDDDAGFVARCRRGETEAFAVLVRRHQKRMLNIAYRMIGDYDEACDAVQEAFLSAWRAIGKFRGDARFSTWLCGIVLNEARDRLARRAVRARSEGVLPAQSAASDREGPSAAFCCGQASPAEAVERRERDAQVQQCIGALDPEHREVLVLRDIQGYSYDEIGAMLKLSEGTVKSRLFRARGALKENLLKILGDRL